MTDFGTTLISGLSYSGGIGNESYTTNFISDPKKGNGLVNKSSGNHTIQIATSNLTANIVIEATLSKDPSVGPWVPIQLVDQITNISTTKLVFDYTPLVPGVACTGKSIQTNKFYTITGQYSWLRANVSNISHGIIQSIKFAF